MSVKKYKFVSPGVFVSEIDNSQLPELPIDMGPVVIGRSVRGPAMQPVQVNSFSEFVTVFGAPPPATSPVDAWRSGDLSAPMYAVYAAQAWLRNNSPITFVRLLGDEHPAKTSGGEAGWFTRDADGDFAGVNATGEGAYGLFVCPSSSFFDAAGLNNVTGALAAVWYFNDGHITLSGTLAGAPEGIGSSSIGTLIKGIVNTDDTKAFHAQVWKNDILQETISFSLNRNSDRYIRKVFNTSPTQTNTRLLSSPTDYFLGQTFDRHVEEAYMSGALGGDARTTETVNPRPYGVILPLKNMNSTLALETADHRKSSQNAQTGWFFSQDLVTFESQTAWDSKANTSNYQASSMPKLFKCHAINSGRWASQNLKISIANIRASTNSTDAYGTFSLEIRDIRDTDAAVRIVERFDNLSMNPESPDYIAKKIGDRYQTWDTTNNRYIVNGDYANNSKFIRVEIDPDAAMKLTDERLLPFGTFGAPRYKSIAWSSGSAGSVSGEPGSGINPVGGQVWALPGHSASFPAQGKPTQDVLFENGAFPLGARDALIGFPASKSDKTGGDPSYRFRSFTASFEFPRMYNRVSSSNGNNQRPSSVYWGVQTNRGSQGYGTYDESTSDVVLSKGKGVTDFGLTTGLTDYSYIFTLDDVTQAANIDLAPQACYVSGSRSKGTSLSALSGTWEAVLDAGFDQFTTTLHGGADGLDRYEKEPFNNKSALASSATDLNSYAYYSVKKAIDSISDSEVVEYNLASVPGVTNEGLTDYLVSVCEDRGDSLAILDMPKVYLPAVDNGKDGANRYGNNPNQAITALKQRRLNSSYACTYYPWVQIQDTINNRTMWAPPSVAALGTFSSSEAKSQLWFAPAGFNRGGLTDGSAGLPVIGVREKLTSKQRDNLYDANINPIASFPAEGIVIFGQKTLQLQRSALDRINVRRLMIFVKKQISRIASNILFDQNVPATWDRFLAQVNPFLSGIQSELGLTDFKVVLDDSTTTPELIDRNILYAKVFLKPARAIEYIAIDFNITNTGAAFED